jgi:hypothetical protein
MVSVDGDDDHDDALGGELAAISEDDLADVSDAEAIHEGHPGRDTACELDLLPHLDHVAVLADQDVVGGDADLGCDLRVVCELPAFAVDGDEPAGPNQRQHQAQLLGRGVSARVHGIRRQMEYVRARSVQTVDDPVDRRLVPRDQAAREHHRVALAKLDPLVLSRRHQ